VNQVEGMGYGDTIAVPRDGAVERIGFAAGAGRLPAPPAFAEMPR
jgi:hypothetical protein